MKNRDIMLQTSASYIREYAYKNGSYIYDFMNAHDVGKSVYGALMDASAKGKGVIAHRLYGHHFLYDFPLNNLHESTPFLEHLLSDLFTKQGLPIIPGELLEDLGLLKYCDKLSNNWNFVNGFDILSGTVAIYSSLKNFNTYFSKEVSIDDFESFASTLGIGTLELAIALSTANPFLLIGSFLNLTSGLKGLVNDHSKAYFRNVNRCLTIEFEKSTLNLDMYLKHYSLERATSSLSLKHSLNDLRL